MTIWGDIKLASIRIIQGQLQEAMNIYKEALQLIKENGNPIPLGAEEVYRGIGELYLERGDIGAAEKNFQISSDIREMASSTDSQHRWCIAKARLNQIQGNSDKALEYLEQAELLQISSPLPVVRSIGALKVGILLSKKRITESQIWVKKQIFPLLMN